jgi:hypothetical protein
MADAILDRARFCSQCGKPVTVADAIYCKDCGAPLAGTEWLSRNITWRPMVALALSVIPGLGHIYKHQQRAAVAWFVAVAATYSMAASLGFMLHAICAMNATLSGAVREEAFTRRHNPRGRAAMSAPARPQP